MGSWMKPQLSHPNCWLLLWSKLPIANCQKRHIPVATIIKECISDDKNTKCWARTSWGFIFDYGMTAHYPKSKSAAFWEIGLGDCKFGNWITCASFANHISILGFQLAEIYTDTTDIAQLKCLWIWVYLTVYINFVFEFRSMQMWLPPLNRHSLACLPSTVNNEKVSPTTTTADWYSN